MAELPLVSHIRTLCQGDAHALGTLLDWTADLLQRPTVKSGRGMVLAGPPGCGKSLFLCLLERLLGPDRVVTAGSLRDLRRPTFEAALVVAFDGPGQWMANAEVRGLISGPTIEISPLFQAPYIAPSYHRVLLTTNAEGMAPDERFAVIPCGFVDGPQFIQDMSDAHQLASLRQALMARPLA